jgi:hypothetical protein
VCVLAVKGVEVVQLIVCVWTATSKIASDQTIARKQSKGRAQLGADNRWNLTVVETAKQRGLKRVCILP